MRRAPLPLSTVSCAPDLPPFTLGPWHVAPALDELRRDERSVKLEPRTMRLLCVLVQARGDLVRTQVLLDTVWPHVVVTPGSLYEAVAQLRKVLGAAAIATVPRKGYRLLAATGGLVPAAAPGAAALGAHSLAVLPFRARGLPDSQAFIRESLLDELIAELSRRPGLIVVARGTMLSYAGQDDLSPQQVGRELGAAHVVDGLLALQGDMLQLRVQVVATDTGTQSWVDTVELPLVDWPDTASLVAGRLARALNFELLDLAMQAPALAGATDPAERQAQQLASRAWVELFARPETREVNARAAAWAQQAQALAPQLPLPWTCLAFCHWRASQFGWGDLPMEPARLLALAHAERAIDLGPREPDAYYVLGLAAHSLGQIVRAEESLRHCLRLSASHAPAHGLLALIRVRRGHPEEAAALCARAFALSPREPLRVVWHLALAWAALALHDYRGALDASQQAMAVNPDFATAYLTGAAAAQQLGATEEARAWIGFLRERTVFKSLHAVRERLAPAREPAYQAQLAQVQALLAAAGLPD